MNKLVSIVIIIPLILIYISTAGTNVQADLKKETPISSTGKERTNEETPAPLIGLSEKEKAELDKSGHKKILQPVIQCAALYDRL